jgi:hypothetical protein
MLYTSFCIHNKLRNEIADEWRTVANESRLVCSIYDSVGWAVKTAFDESGCGL